jgi:hypothetical protein
VCNFQLGSLMSSSEWKHGAGQVIGARYAAAVEHLVEIAISGVVGVGLLGRGILVVLRGEAPTGKATGRTWRSAGEAGVFWFLLGSAMLIVAFMWISAATGFAGPDGVVDPDASFCISFVLPTYASSPSRAVDLARLPTYAATPLS